MRTYDLTKSGGPLYYALYRALRDDIAAGALTAGEKLPGKRALAERLGVSVVTVETAYQMLADEGYIRSRERSGHYVQAIGAAGSVPAIGDAGREPLRLLPEEEPGPGAADFPYSLWFKTLRQVMADQGKRLVDRSPNEGCAVLRNAIARYLLRYRGMYAQPERIVVGSGSEQLYQAVVRMLGHERTYAIEWPSYGQIEAVYRGAGANVERLPIGPDGIRSDALAAAEADVLHVTPFHSWPTGASAPAAKRYEYLAWAERPGRFIVEDDFDSEFFQRGKPPDTLYALDDRDRVIYLNTFSKSLAPSMRMGYMILPEGLLGTYRERVGMYSCTVPVLEQYALAAFIDQGHFERHLNRVRRRQRSG